MPRHGKNFTAARGQVEDRLYPLDEALQAVRDVGPGGAQPLDERLAGTGLGSRACFLIGQGKIDQMTDRALVAAWPIDRIDPTLRALFRAAGAELIAAVTPPKVVITGPYRYARNPMLTGVFLFLFGIGFIFNSASLVFFFTPLYMLINVWELKKIEEPELIKRLGNEYIEYRNHTPMFIPGCRSRSK